MAAFVSWIDKEFKNYYLDSTKRGLRITVHSGVDPLSEESVKNYLRFLRKRYFFPIRCNIHLTPQEKFHSKDGGYCCGVFFPGEENRRRWPSIYLPVNRGIVDTDCIFGILHDLTALLTYYFQWYFMQEDERTHRSLEIEATRMANYLLEEYFYEKESGRCK